MLDDSEDKTQSLQELSALADGELDTAAVASACAHWRGDASTRASWHTYHLIGDVMRSEELASSAMRDAGFLRGVAERLATEPVVLAPQPPKAAAARTSSRWSWMGPAAVAAGFMAVASVLVVTRGTAPSAGTDASMARSWTAKDGLAPTALQGAPGVIGAEGASEPMTLVADGQLVRDARLERYLAAHKQFGGSSALGVPSGFLRAATTQTPGR